MARNVSSRDLISCLLCFNPACSKACPKNINPGKILRSLRFENYIGAIEKINGECINCSAPCEKSCVVDNVRIKEILSRCYNEKNIHNIEIKRANLKSDICGIPIENPFLLSSSIVASTYDMCKRALEAGWAGVAFKTISLIDIHEASPRYSALKNLDGSFQAFKNIEQLYDHSIDEGFEIIKRLKKEFPSKFILVSIMGRDEDEWKFLAKKAEESMADALELNFSCPNMTEDDTGSDVGQIPRLVESFTKAVKESVKIPVLAKLTPNVMTMSPAAIAAKRGGADGIALINTIKSITELNIIQKLLDKKWDRKIAVGGLSGSSVKPIALRFLAEVAQNEELKGMHLSAMGGIYNYKDALMFLSLGAKSLQLTTAVMEYGYRIIEDLTEGLSTFLGSAGIELKDLCGASINNVVDIKEMKRDIVIYPKFGRTSCVGCGRCYISCMDGGHQAIKLVDNKPQLDTNKCVGCHLCILVCPEGAIQSSGVEVKLNK